MFWDWYDECDGWFDSCGRGLEWMSVWWGLRSCLDVCLGRNWYVCRYGFV